MIISKYYIYWEQSWCAVSDIVQFLSEVVIQQLTVFPLELTTYFMLTAYPLSLSATSDLSFVFSARLCLMQSSFNYRLNIVL